MKDTSQYPVVMVVDPTEALLVQLRETRPDFHLVGARTPEQALDALHVHVPDVLLVDQSTPGGGVELLRASLERRPDAVRILAVGAENTALAVDAVNQAHVGRFVLTPCGSVELRATLQGALREAALVRENQRLVRELTHNNKLLSRALAQVLTQEKRLEQEVERRTLELREAITQLEDLALRDGLTGLYNHRYFQEALTMELAQAARYRRPLALLFLDVDHFKVYNDTWGHPQGDALLKQLARLLDSSGTHASSEVRGRVYDMACRYGGEEFVVILPEADRVGGRARAERIRAQVEEFPFPGRERQPLGKVSVSIGVAAYPEDGLGNQALIQAADQALLRAKRGGRNAVGVAGQP